ncbi:universal stress protein [Haloplanus rubicundus]|uniref:Universal stress protein n=1 Tax=Haloplanus rubicundus TaxID=1547898 RepID=A0A345E098_9EURY|nr:universal stress protein [Haloplanus rubicundus]AXG05620.1 universal stress protein [Haloplanus rubicundus]AXG08967.1 universal stress protein [Haloplanus rubicundus]
MPRTHLVVVNDGHNLHSALDYTCETFPDDTIVGLYVDTADDGPRSIRWDDSATPATDWIDGHREEARRHFDDAQAVADKYGVTLETVAAFGKLTDVIRQYCTQHSITTVIVGTADRDAFSSYVVADDVTRIANTAPVPVVVV